MFSLIMIIRSVLLENQVIESQMLKTLCNAGSVCIEVDIQVVDHVELIHTADINNFIWTLSFSVSHISNIHKAIICI